MAPQNLCAGVALVSPAFQLKVGRQPYIRRSLRSPVATDESIRKTVGIVRVKKVDDIEGKRGGPRNAQKVVSDCRIHSDVIGNVLIISGPCPKAAAIGRQQRDLRGAVV